MLRGVDSEIISSVRTKQAALVLLARQTHLVEHMMHEGLLSEKDGEVFFEKFREDEVEIRKSRRKDYRYRKDRWVAIYFFYFRPRFLMQSGLCL
jgi:hypothetical protein